MLFLMSMYFIIEYLGDSFSSPTGYFIISLNGSNELLFDDTYAFFNNSNGSFEFSSRFSEDILNHDSWHIGGFSRTNIFDQNDKAVFYVDVGVVTPYVQVDNERYWCKSILKDWSAYHSLKITVNNKTNFYIDGENICELSAVPKYTSKTFIGESDRRGNLRMYAMDIKNY